MKEKGENIRDKKKSGKTESFGANFITSRPPVQSLTEAYILLKVKGNYKNV